MGQQHMLPHLAVFLSFFFFFDAVADFIFLGSKITVGSDCSHEIKRYLLHSSSLKKKKIIFFFT